MWTYVLRLEKAELGLSVEICRNYLLPNLSRIECVFACLSRKFCHLTLSDASSQITLGYSVSDGPIGESVRVAPRQMYSRQHAAFDQNQVIIWPCGWEYFWRIFLKRKKWLKSLGTRGRNVYEAKMDEIKFGMRDRNVYEAMQKCDFTTLLEAEMSTKVVAMESFYDCGEGLWCFRDMGPVSLGDVVWSKTWDKAFLSFFYRYIEKDGNKRHLRYSLFRISLRKV